MESAQPERDGPRRQPGRPQEGRRLRPAVGPRARAPGARAQRRAHGSGRRRVRPDGRQARLPARLRDGAVAVERDAEVERGAGDLVPGHPRRRGEEDGRRRTPEARMGPKVRGGGGVPQGRRAGVMSGARRGPAGAAERAAAQAVSTERRRAARLLPAARARVASRAEGGRARLQVQVQGRDRPGAGVLEKVVGHGSR